MPTASNAGNPTSTYAERVLLLCMPWGAIERPALSLGLLHAHCTAMGIECETRYLNFSFAKRVGIDNYLWLCSNNVPYTAFAGEWLFTASLYGSRPYSDAAYIDEILCRTWRLSRHDRARLLRMRDHVEPFLDHCLLSIQWADFTFVGFTSVFQQNIASLALAARVKREHPHITIAFGGANWEDVMGVALQQQFPFVDLVFSGEADRSFPAVLNARRRRVSLPELRNISYRDDKKRSISGPAEPIQDLDPLPIPNFDPFFEQQAGLSGTGIGTTLLMETTRGCWWGERSHCTFCGLNGATMTYRSKSPERVLAEIQSLYERYGLSSFSMVDDILDMHFFQSLLPMLADAKLGIHFFWEVKANLDADHVRLLRDAGVRSIQPGLESLSDHVLMLMRKGTTALRNIELLKWCSEYKVKPYWNFLYGFPGEIARDYTASIALIEAIWHLEPPTGYGPIRLDRFSPYHANPAAFGMVNVRPLAPFFYLYPFDRKTLMKIAYYFDFDYADDHTSDTFAHEAVATVRRWMADNTRGQLEMWQESDATLYIFDTRRELATAPRRAILRGWKAATYLACDRAQTFDSLLRLSAVQEEGVPDGDLRLFLGRCVEHQLMVTNGQKWLGVAVRKSPREAFDRSLEINRNLRQSCMPDAQQST